MEKEKKDLNIKTPRWLEVVRDLIFIMGFGFGLGVAGAFLFYAGCLIFK